MRAAVLSTVAVGVSAASDKAESSCVQAGLKRHLELI